MPLARLVLERDGAALYHQRKDQWVADLLIGVSKPVAGLELTEQTSIFKRILIKPIRKHLNVG